MAECGQCGPVPCGYTIDQESRLVMVEKCGIQGNVEVAPPRFYKTETILTEAALSSHVDTYTPDSSGGCDKTTAPADPLAVTSDCPTQAADAITETHQGDHCTSGADDGAQTASDDLSDEDTTGDIEGRAAAQLGAAAWDESGSTFAQRNLADDESSITLGDFRFRVTHAPSASCFLKAWYRIITEDIGGGDPVVGAWTAFYTWTGSGAPCLDGASSGSDQSIGSDWVTIDAPSVNSAIVVETYVTCDAWGAPPE